MYLMDSTVPDNHYDNAKKEKDHPHDTLEFKPDLSVLFSNVFAHPNDNCVDHTNSQSDVITVDEGAPTTAEVNNNSDDEEAVDVWDESWVRDAMLDEQQKKRVNKWVGLYSIAEEWERQRQLNRPVDNKNCLCFPSSQYEHRLQSSTDWYRSDFIAGFAALIQYDTHITTPNYKSSNQVLMVFTPYPNKPVN